MSKSRYSSLIVCALAVMLVVMTGCNSNIENKPDNTGGFNSVSRLDDSKLTDIEIKPNVEEHDHLTVDDLDEEAKELLGQLGMADDSVVIDTDSGGKLVGDLAKKVHQFQTLHDAETYMGYYLGLHNTLKCSEDYSLVGMYDVADLWYQALFESETEGHNPITVKVSKTSPVEDLIEAYGENNYIILDAINIDDVEVTFQSNDDTNYNLAYFSVKNGKAYSIFTSVGVDRELFKSITQELIANLKIMDDWAE